MSFTIGTMLLIINLFGYILFFKKLFNYNFGKALFLSLVLIMFLMSIFSMLNVMLFGFYFLSLFGFFSCIYHFVESRNNFKNFFHYFNNPAFLLFLIFLILIGFASSNITSLMQWDECSYWGTMVKRLFYFNTYLGGENFHSMYYPPALTSYNYYVIKYLGMTDKSLYISQYLFIFSGIIFIVRNIKWNQILYGFYSVIALFLFLILLLNPFLLTIYSEIPLIIMLAAAIILLFNVTKKSDYFFIIIMLMNITWIKSNGLVACVVVSLIALFQILYKTIWDKESNIKNFKYKKFLKTIIKNWPLIFVSLAPFIAHFMFNIFLNINNIQNPQSLSGGKDNIMGMLSNTGQYNDVLNNFLLALNSNYTYSPYIISSIFLLIIFIIGFMILFKIFKNKNENINKNKYINLAYFLSFIIYAIALFYSYSFLFSSNEAKILASFDRYMNTYIGGIGLAFIGIIIYYLNDKDKNIQFKIKSYILVIMLALLTITNISETFKFISHFTSEQINLHEIKKGYEISEKYKEKFTENDKIHLIAQEDYGLTVWSTIYYMTPLKIYDPRFEGDCWSLRLPGSEIIDKNTIEMSSESYIDFLKNNNFTHVIVINSSLQFSKDYNCIFETKNDYIEKGVYKLNNEINKLIFLD